MVRHMIVYRFLFLIFLIGIIPTASAQLKKQGMKELFRDSLDHAFDVSRFLIEVKGFIPVPFIITEPALGNFGGGLGLVFLNKRVPLVDTIRGKVKVTPLPPDITGLFGFYSANNSWGTGAMRSGMWGKPRLRYRLVAAYVNLNLSIYRTDESGDEHKADFNFKTVPITGFLMKQFRGSFWSAGLEYLFLKTEVGMENNSLPEYVEDKEVESIVSMPGLVVEFDTRDNIFTPDKGLRIRASMGLSDKAVGSDYDYQNLSMYVYGYRPLSKKVIGGLRYEMQQVFNDAPFYLLPYLNLRGIPVARYQGNIFSVVETEVRWDCVPRWSLVGFAGTGKAYNEWDEFSDTDWHTSGGAGFRYLVARQFKLRMGMDLARGPEQWAYYIVFGSAWLK